MLCQRPEQSQVGCVVYSGLIGGPIIEQNKFAKMHDGKIYREIINYCKLNNEK